MFTSFNLVRVWRPAGMLVKFLTVTSSAMKSTSSGPIRTRVKAGLGAILAFNPLLVALCDLSIGDIGDKGFWGMGPAVSLGADSAGPVIVGTG